MAISAAAVTPSIPIGRESGLKLRTVSVQIRPRGREVWLDQIMRKVILVNASSKEIRSALRTVAKFRPVKHILDS